MTLYEKRGRRYYPVHDDRALDGLRNGDYLVMVRDGCMAIRLLVEPWHAAFLASAEVAREAMVAAMRESSAARPRSERLSPKERKAFAAWKAVMGEDIMWLEKPHAYEIADAGIAAVRAAHEASMEGDD